MALLFILVLFISFFITYNALANNKSESKKKDNLQDLKEDVSSNNLSKEQQKQNFYKDAEFVNKNCTNLEDFIINDKINSYDLKKLADLNKIPLHIKSGWYPLVIKLMQELNEDGWDKTVSCIKEKYGFLRFYASHKHNDILRKYEEKSEEICEICGEKGELRISSWDYVACRKHYLERRGQIIVQDSGFNHNGDFYQWNAITNAIFQDKYIHDENYRTLIITFNKPIVKLESRYDIALRISKRTIGFGNLLNNLPSSLRSLNYNYIQNFKNIEYCEICGFKAVYFGECECCENDTWLHHQKRWNSEKEKSSEKEEQEKKYEYVSYRQLRWVRDEGELYESRQNNYPKNPDHTILYTEQELKDHLEAYEDEWFF